MALKLVRYWKAISRTVTKASYRKRVIFFTVLAFYYFKFLFSLHPEGLTGSDYYYFFLKSDISFSKQSNQLWNWRFFSNKDEWFDEKYWSGTESVSWCFFNNKIHLPKDWKIYVYTYKSVISEDIKSQLERQGVKITTASENIPSFLLGLLVMEGTSEGYYF